MNINSDVHNCVEHEPDAIYQNSLQNTNILVNESALPYRIQTSPKEMSSNLKTLKELEHLHEKNDSLTRRLSIYSIPALYFMGTVIVMTILSNFNIHPIGLLSTMMGFGGVILLITLLGSIEADMCPHFKWMHKLLRKSKRFNKKEIQYENYLNSLYNFLKTDEFAHTYLAHVQMKLTHYQQVALELSESENRQYHFFHLNKLKERIEKLQELQSILVECLVQKVNQDNLFAIELIEEKIQKIDTMLNDKTLGSPAQKEFVQKHQKFLDNNDLSHLIASADNNWTNHQNKTHERNLKTLL
jgi:hypothetical protein